MSAAVEEWAEDFGTVAAAEEGAIVCSFGGGGRPILHFFAGGVSVLCSNSSVVPLGSFNGILSSGLSKSRSSSKSSSPLRSESSNSLTLEKNF